MRPSTLLKQRKIIEVATALFIKQGFTRTNLDQVIELCGGSKQTIYSYYGDKRGLLMAVVTHNIEKVGVAFNFRHNRTQTLEARLNKFGVDYLTLALSDTVLGLSRLIITESYHDKELAKLFLEGRPNQLSQKLAEFLQEQMDLGNLKSDSAEKASENLVCLLKGYYYNSCLFGSEKPKPREIRRHVEQAVACFLRGYAP